MYNRIGVNMTPPLCSHVDEDRRRRLRDLEAHIQDQRSVLNVDSLVDAVQAIVADCDHPAIRKIKNVDAFVSRCKWKKQSHKYQIKSVFHSKNDQ